MSSIWYDSIIAQNILIHLHTDRRPEFYSFRRLNRIWYSVYHETVRFTVNCEDPKQMAIDLLKSTLRTGSGTFEFHETIRAQCDKQYVKYAHPSMACGPKKIQYAIKFDYRDFVQNYIQHEYAKDVEADVLADRRLLKFVVRYKRNAIYRNIMAFCKTDDTDMIHYLTPGFLSNSKMLKLCLQHCAYKILKHEMQGMESDDLNLKYLDLRDCAKCNPKHREKIIFHYFRDTIQEELSRINWEHRMQYNQIYNYVSCFPDTPECSDYDSDDSDYSDYSE